MNTMALSRTPTLSVVVACFNDHENLRKTLSSLSGELFEDDEIVVVDSSTDHLSTKRVITEAGVQQLTKYMWVPPNGVYPAHNKGITVAKGKWIQIVNSGDRYLKGARVVISQVEGTDKAVPIHVFSQESGFDNVKMSTYFPTEKGIWPHQSIIVAKSVYDFYGLYDLNYAVVADQIYFAKVRKFVPYKIYENPITYYDLCGISSRVGLKYSFELFEMWRLFGESVAFAIYRSFVAPNIRALFGSIVGPKRLSWIRARVKLR